VSIPGVTPTMLMSVRICRHAFRGDQTASMADAVNDLQGLVDRWRRAKQFPTLANLLEWQQALIRNGDEVMRLLEAQQARAAKQCRKWWQLYG